MTKNTEPSRLQPADQVTLRSPAELADALPYLMGFHPDDSVVMVALHGARGRFGGRLRLGIPDSPDEWPHVSGQLAECLVTGSERRDGRPDGIIVFLCRDPSAGETGQTVMENLRPLAQRLRTACGDLDVPVLEALCVSDGRFWSYCCPDPRCCPPEGTPLALPGTSVMAAAAAYAGIRVRGSLSEMEARLAPLDPPVAQEQEVALDAAAAALLPRILDGLGRESVCAETIGLARLLIDRLAAAPPDPAGHRAADAADDALLAHDEAAALLLGLQDRMTRDRAAEWMEGPETEPALRLWRALARRCVGAYADHAAAPLTLAGWVAWSTGDEPAARVALGRALGADPDYVFARLLHQGVNEGLDPERLRRCLRQERDDRDTGGPDATGCEASGSHESGLLATGPDRTDSPRNGNPGGCPDAGGPGPAPERTAPKRSRGATGAGRRDLRASREAIRPPNGDRPGPTGPTATTGQRRRRARGRHRGGSDSAGHGAGSCG